MVLAMCSGVYVGGIWAARHAARPAEATAAPRPQEYEIGGLVIDAGALDVGEVYGQSEGPARHLGGKGEP